MARIDTVEEKIFQVEGFKVIICDQFGNDIRGDRTGIPQWPYGNAAKDNWTVGEWMSGRFLKTYPGFTVKVLYDDGSMVVGQTILATVRKSY